MIKNKAAIAISLILLGICMYLYFPFPNDIFVEARNTFMSFPITDQDGIIPLGIVGSILFITALALLVIGLKKHRLITVITVAIAYSVIPSILITVYQETVADGVEAVSYDRNGKCNFDLESEDLLIGKCNLSLTNRSSEPVTFELVFLDSPYMEDEVRMESLMNLAGPYRMTIDANQKTSIEIKEPLNLSDVPNHFKGSGTSDYVPIKLIGEETVRVLIK